MIRTKKYYRWALISDLIANTNNTPEQNITEAEKYLAYIFDKPYKSSKKIINMKTDVEKQKRNNLI